MVTVTEAARGELMRAGLPLAASAQIVVTTPLSAQAGVRCGHSAHHSSYYRSDVSTQTTTVHCQAAAGDWCGVPFIVNVGRASQHEVITTSLVMRL